MRRRLWLAACISVISAGVMSVHRDVITVRRPRSSAIEQSLKMQRYALQPLFLSARMALKKRPLRRSGPGPAPARVRLLARLIQAEAGDQSYATEVAVGAVVVNRTKSPVFPHRLLAVITQPRQFSVVSAGTFALARPTIRAWRAAQAALAGVDPAPGALYFYNPVLPHVAWMNGLQGCRTVGALRFCHGMQPVH